METLDHRILKMTFLLLGGFISFTDNKKSFSRLVNRPSDTNLRLVFTEEDNITNDFEIVFIVRS